MPTASQLTVTGNLGSDAQLKHTKAKSTFKTVYDPIIDDLIEKPVTVDAQPFVTFSLAENRQNPDGTKTTIWYSVTSFNPNDEVQSLRKGDRVTVRGDFSKNSYLSNGVDRTELRLRLRELTVERKAKAPQASADESAPAVRTPVRPEPAAILGSLDASPPNMPTAPLAGPDKVVASARRRSKRPAKGAEL